MALAARQSGDSAAEERLGWSDERLVSGCLSGDQQAWSALIDRYKNLVFSIPLKHGLSRDDAAEIFQAVCLEMLKHLPKLREPKAVCGWLIRVTSHKVLRHREQQQKLVELPADMDVASGQPAPESILRGLECEQALRDAIRQLQPRCRQLVHALFFEDPPRPYNEVAASLGLAIGSIGFIRGRCLRKLRELLHGAGF
jgi:RNA polymerase sigma factor (sigma-70 family)